MQLILIYVIKIFFCLFNRHSWQRILVQFERSRRGGVHGIREEKEGEREQIFKSPSRTLRPAAFHICTDAPPCISQPAFRLRGHGITAMRSAFIFAFARREMRCSPLRVVYAIRTTLMNVSHACSSSAFELSISRCFPYYCLTQK